MSIYEDGPGAGWTWRAVGVRDSKLILAKQGRSGSNAACAWAKSPGGVSFICPGCSASGEAPFAKGKYLWFWIRSNSNAGVLSSTPVGSLPALRVVLGNDNTKQFCGTDLILGKTAEVQKQERQWYRFAIPLSAFQCGTKGRVKSLADVNRLEFQNINTLDADFCLDEIRLIEV